jgi:hypothetical protein
VKKELASVYEDLARDLDGYPKTIEKIFEQTQTYNHYERAQWL